MNLIIKILKKNLDPSGGPVGCIHVCNHDIQRYSSVKPLWQSKSNFIGSICMNVEPMYL